MALTSKKLIGVRDPYGVRPLVLGKLDGAYILSSETCALDIIGAEFVRDIGAGEMVVVTKDGIESLHPFPVKPHRFCIFEYVYFARPDSMVEGHNVYEARKRIGEELAREAPAEADMVIPVPDSGVPAALGYANASGLPFELGIIRNHYVGRTFIEPSDRIRHLGVKLKHNPNREKLAGKKRGAGGRFHRARHDLEKDRGNGARCGRQGSAFPHRQPAHDQFLFLRRRYAEQARICSRTSLTSRACANSSTPTVWPSFRWTACIAPSARRSATRRRRNSAMPASPANIRSSPPTRHGGGKDRQLSLLAEVA